MRSKPLRTIGIALVVLFVAGSFIELGIWQIHRAQEVERLQAPPIEQPAVSLTSIASTGSDLAGTSVNRVVEMKGHYIKFFRAPNQSVTIHGKAETANLKTGLFCLNNVDAAAVEDCILVVRGIPDPASDAIADLNPQSSLELTVVGRLYPRQVRDRAMGSDTELSRLDPALVTGIPGTALFDGYVIAQSERSATGAPSNILRIDSPMVKPQVPGYFWQHISYVFIWWMLAVLVLIAPIYRRRETGRPASDGEME